MLRKNESEKDRTQQMMFSVFYTAALGGRYVKINVYEEVSDHESF